MLLPIPRWRLYAAKAICVVGAAAVMTVLNLVFTIAAVHLAGAIKPAVAPVGAPDLARFAVLNAKVLATARPGDRHPAVDGAAFRQLRADPGGGHRPPGAPRSVVTPPRAL
uniref:hypothetical protein n=1 Tax=uncultured Caulobacter sp. TaxID=158749 RepID=UPI0025F54CF0|nr:hypothetical protein [uncultured Caulobacter sp.]